MALPGPKPAHYWRYADFDQLLTALTSLYNTSTLAPSSPYCAAIYNTSSGQSLPSATLVTVNFTTKELDTDSAVTTGASWHFTCPAGKAGLYHVSSVIGLQMATHSADVFSEVFKNGAEVQRGARLYASATSFVYSCLSADLTLAAGDTVSISAYQGSTDTLALEATNLSNRVSIHRVLGS